MEVHGLWILGSDQLTMIKQDKNAFAYVIYERPSNKVVEDGVEVEWVRSLMFYADDPAHSNRDSVWNHYVAWRDPENIRVVSLYDEDGNDARREANLDAINAQYQADTVDHSTLASAVETALEINLPLDRFEGLLKTLQAFDGTVMDQLQVSPHTIERADYLPSIEQLDALKHFDH